MNATASATTATTTDFVCPTCKRGFVTVTWAGFHAPTCEVTGCCATKSDLVMSVTVPASKPLEWESKSQFIARIDLLRAELVAAEADYRAKGTVTARRKMVAAERRYAKAC